VDQTFEIDFACTSSLSPAVESGDSNPPAPLGPSRRGVYGLAGLFAVDAFGGGLILNALMALWLLERFGLSVSTTGAIFFVTKLCAAISYIASLRPYQHHGVHAPAGQHLPCANCIRSPDRIWPLPY
jgi:hypothetical protein